MVARAARRVSDDSLALNTSQALCGDCCVLVLPE